MNKKIQIYASAATIVTILFSAVFTAVRVYLMQNAYDFVRGFYTNESLHMLMRYSLIAIAVVCFAAAYIYIKEEKNSKGLPESTLTTYAAYVGAGAFAGLLLYTFAKFLLPMLRTPSGVDILLAVIGVVAMLYFATFIYKQKIGDTRALLCSSVALALLFLVFGLYFNTSISYINHSIVLTYATAIFLMLATVAEANGLLRRPCFKRYLAFAPTAVILAFTLSIPDLIYAVTNGAAPITDIFYDIIFLSLGIFHLSRIITICKVKELA